MDQSQAPTNNTIKLRIDTLAGRQSNLFSTIVIVLLGAVFLLASYAPEGYSTQVRSIVDCSTFSYNIPGYSCDPYDAQKSPTIGVEVTDIGYRNQFLVLELSPLQMSSHEPLEVPVKVKVNAYTLQPQDSTGTHLDEETKDIVFECSFSQEEPCDSQEIYSIPKIDARGYYFTISFNNNQDIISKINNFQVSTKTLNIASRNFRFVTKLILFAIAALTILMHMLKMSIIKKYFLTHEQRLIQFIAPLLLVVNEPFSAHLFEGVMYSWIAIFCFAIFSSLLVWLWLMTIDNLAGSDSSLIEKSSTFAKVYVPIYFITLFITYGTLGHCALHDPLFSFYSGQNWFFKIMKFILFGILIAGLFWMVSKTYRILKRINDVSERENAFYWFSIFFILSHFYFVFRGNLYPFSYESAGLILFNGISTLYVLSISYLFLPTQEGVTQANYLKKLNIGNPAVKNSYKDLEESVVHSQKNLNKDTHPTERTGEDKAQLGVQMVSLERNAAEQQYPYEKRGDEDF